MGIGRKFDGFRFFLEGKTGSKIGGSVAIHKNRSGNQTGIHCRPPFTSMYFSIFSLFMAAQLLWTYHEWLFLVGVDHQFTGF
jgi:hypothetical protein